MRGPADLVCFHVAFELYHCAIATHPELYCIEHVRVAKMRPQPQQLTSLATDVIKRSSWEMTITPPFQVFNASIRASRPSKSRWLVGYPEVSRLHPNPNPNANGKTNTGARTSSSSKMCGRCNDSTENATRDFWPPLSVPMGCNPVMPLIWKLPRCCRYSCSVFPGNLCARNWTGFIVGMSVSTWCCAK